MQMLKSQENIQFEDEANVESKYQYWISSNMEEIEPNQVNLTLKLSVKYFDDSNWIEVSKENLPIYVKEIERIIKSIKEELE